MKKQVNEIIIKEELYPRDRINNSKVEEYSEILSVLPPIIINQENILIDGAHRLFAFKKREQKEIDVEIIKTKDNDDLFLKAVELNAKHGYQLTQREKKNQIIKLYHKILKNESKSYDVKRLKEAFSIPDSTFSDWTKDLNDELESQQLQKILDLWLQCKTQEEIGNLLGMKQNTISDKIKEIEQFLNEISDSPISEIPIKYQFLSQKFKEISEFKPLYYNHHFINILKDDNTHFGKFPEYYLNNLLYYYTDIFDIIYDPFAGGGTTIDCCKNWLRKYYCSDLNPIETRTDIKKWDINKGIPKECPSPDFVFLDPPYWLQAKEKYSKDKEDLANMTLNEFYTSIEKLIKELKRKMKSGYIAFVISPTQWSNENHKFEDHIIKIINLFEENGFKEEMRYVLPFSTEQYNGTQVEISKKEKFPLNIIRDLVIFKKIVSNSDKKENKNP